MITDMSVGKPWQVLMKFSLPLLFSSIFQQLYNIMDSVIAGQFLGESALAAIGASYPITMIFIAIAFGMSQGSSVVISHFFGAHKLTETKTTINTAFITIMSISVILTVFGAVFCTTMLEALDTPPDILEASSAYLSVYTYGLVFLFLYNACTSIFSALGDSRTPLFLLIISSVLNIALDLVFVACFKMDVSSLALATLIAQGVSAVASITVLMKRLKKLEYKQKPRLFSGIMLGKILRLSIPSVLQQSFVSVGNLFIQSLINSFGQSAIVAGYSAAIKINTFTVTCAGALSGGVSNFTAQNIGAGKPERVKSGYKTAILIVEAISVLMIAVVFIFGEQLVSLFMKEPSQTALDTGMDFLRIVSPFYIFVSAKLVADSVIKGAGAIKFFMISTFIDLILRVILAYILSAPLGVDGIWWSWPVGWIIASVLAQIFYFKGVWKTAPKLTE